MTDDIKKANELASICHITPEEIKVLFQGERRNNPTGLRTVWDDSVRQAKKALLLEELE